jgi:hypothetical protein
MLAAAVPSVLEVTAKTPLPKAMPPQLEEDGIVRAVHVTPSDDDAAAADGPAATAMKELLPYVTAFHLAVVGSVRAVQSMPLSDEAAMVLEVLDKATKTPLPKARPSQQFVDVCAPDSQVLRSDYTA